MLASRGARLGVAAIALLVFLAATTLTLFLANTVHSTSIAFDNDEANHAIDGWEVSLALANLSAPDLYSAIAGQGFYPPIHSFFVAAAYLLAGPSLASSRLPTVIIFALSLLGLGWLTFRLARRGSATDQRDGWLALAAATFAVALAITSQIYVTLAVLVMLEMTAALFGILLFLAAYQADVVSRDSSRWCWIVVAAHFAVATLLTKYSFGLFFVPGLIAGLVTATMPWKSGRRAWQEAFAVASLCVIGIGAWYLITDRTTMLLFFTDHRSDARILSAQNLLYLPHVWSEHYSASAIVALLVVLLAGIGAVRQWRWLAVRVATWSILAGLLTLTVSTTNEPRHFLPLAPGVWFLAGLGLAEVLRWQHGKIANETTIVIALIAVLLLVGVSAIGRVITLRSALVDALEGDPAFLSVQDRALQQIDIDQPVLFIGDFDDQNGLLALRWRAATSSQRSLWDMEIDFFPYEQYSHSLERTNRKPQIDVLDPDFPHTYMNEVLAQEHYPTVVEVKRMENYYGPRSVNPADPLCPYPASEAQVDGWMVTIYDASPARRVDCETP